MRGRKPALEPLGSDVEILPSSAVRIPDCPSSLQTEREKEVWEDTTRIMVARSIYDEDCRDMVAAYCYNWARVLEANEIVRREGRVIVEQRAQQSFQVLHPELVVSNNAFDKCLRLACELGLTPVSRKRIVRTKQINQPIAANKYLKKVG